jgi:hypothetical protein
MLPCFSPLPYKRVVYTKFLGTLVIYLQTECEDPTLVLLPPHNREKHCLSRSADPGVLAEGSFFFTPRVLCLLIFSRKLKQEEWISFLNEQIKLEL